MTTPLIELTDTEVTHLANRVASSYLSISNLETELETKIQACISEYTKSMESEKESLLADSAVLFQWAQSNKHKLLKNSKSKTVTLGSTKHKLRWILGRPSVGFKKGWTEKRVVDALKKAEKFDYLVPSYSLNKSKILEEIDSLSILVEFSVTPGIVEDLVESSIPKDAVVVYEPADNMRLVIDWPHIQGTKERPFPYEPQVIEVKTVKTKAKG